VVEVQTHAPVFSRDVRNLQQKQRPMSMQSKAPMYQSHLTYFRLESANIRLDFS
jgi:hypothetical protein